jgi:hypothetical protein
MAGVKTQLTKLYYRTGTSGSYDLVAIPSVTAVPISTPSASNIDVTDLDSTAKEFIVGLVDNGSFTLTLNHISFGQTGAAAYEAFMGQAIGTSTTYVVAMADGTVAPTIDDTTGVITYSTGRSHRTFTGIFGGAGDTFNVDDAVRATANITISGAITRTPKSA